MGDSAELARASSPARARSPTGGASPGASSLPTGELARRKDTSSALAARDAGVWCRGIGCGDRPPHGTGGCNGRSPQPIYDARGPRTTRACDPWRVSHGRSPSRRACSERQGTPRAWENARASERPCHQRGSRPGRRTWRLDAAIRSSLSGLYLSAFALAFLAAPARLSSSLPLAVQMRGFGGAQTCAVSFV